MSQFVSLPSLNRDMSFFTCSRCQHLTYLPHQLYLCNLLLHQLILLHPALDFTFWQSSNGCTCFILITLQTGSCFESASHLFLVWWIYTPLHLMKYTLIHKSWCWNKFCSSWKFHWAPVLFRCNVVELYLCASFMHLSHCAFHFYATSVT